MKMTKFGEYDLPIVMLRDTHSCITEQMTATTFIINNVFIFIIHLNCNRTILVLNTKQAKRLFDMII